MKSKIFLLTLLALPVMLACSLLRAATPTPDLLATLRSSTPLAQTQAADGFPPEASTQPPFQLTPVVGNPTAIPSVSIPETSGGPGGHIVFTCQIYKVQAANQICIMNPDGSGWKRLTTDDGRQHYYGSLSPDGKSIVYAAFRQENVYEIYELSLADGKVKQLTDKLGVLNAPEISPDGNKIIFMHWSPETDRYEVWIRGL